MATDRADCLRSKRSDTDKSLLSQVGFWGHQSRKGLFVGLWRKRTRMLRPMPEWPSDRLHRFIDFPEKSFIP